MSKKTFTEKENDYTNLDWIFEHGEEIVNGKRRFSFRIAETLFGCISDHNMMPHGESIFYLRNMIMVREYAKPFLEKNDKIGWLNFCKNFN